MNGIVGRISTANNVNTNKGGQKGEDVAKVGVMWMQLCLVGGG